VNIADLEFAGFRTKVLEGAKIRQRPEGSQPRNYVRNNIDKLIGGTDPSISRLDTYGLSGSGYGLLLAVVELILVITTPADRPARHQASNRPTPILRHHASVLRPGRFNHHLRLHRRRLWME
jgi:hypothetical protein